MINYSDPQPLWKDVSIKAEQILLEAATEVVLNFDYMGTAYNVNIPSGWTTDLGSVPSIVRNIVSNTGAVDIAFILHDAIYGTGWIEFCPEAKEFTRQDADIILWLKLKERGLNWFKANLVYRALRMFGGGSHWRHSL